MINPEQFRHYTNDIFSGLKADDELKNKIIQKSVFSDGPESKKPFNLTVPVMCSMMVLLLWGVFVLNGWKSVVSTEPLSGMNSFPAGQTMNEEFPLDCSPSLGLSKGLSCFCENIELKKQ